MVYFTRHGESEANIEMIFSNKGFKHLLTENGNQQAVILSNSLVEKNISRIFSSPVLRAIQTTSIIAIKLNILSFEIHEYLREYDVGILEGKSDKNSWNMYFDNEKQWKEINNKNSKLPNGESYSEITRRFLDFINDKILNGNIKENVLIVSHGGLLKIGLAEACKNIDYAFTCNNPIKNCELITCEIENNQLICSKWGNINLR